MAKLRVLGDGDPRRLKPVNAPRPIQVKADRDGLPVEVFRAGWDGWRRVVRVQDRWRVDDEWWRAAPISRLYFEVLFDGDLVFSCYHDLVSDQWYEQRDT